ncbi:hypothetical protein APHAL10511_002537 [Amanita phalloides]|nr:hypothetical protein APHAL10511_002537 [Amanita phalloides]
MPFYSSVLGTSFQPPHSEPVIKIGASAGFFDEIISYLTSESESEFSSRSSSPCSQLTTSTTAHLLDDIEVERPHGTIFRYRDIAKEQDGVDPRLLFAPCRATVQESQKDDTLQPENSLDEHDDGPYYEDSDEEYIPPEEARRPKRMSSSHCSSTPSKKPRAQFTSSVAPDASLPNSSNGNLKYRARNIPLPTDDVELELKRIRRTRVPVAKKTGGRKNKGLSCGLCGSTFTRSSDLQRHVLTHDPSSTKSAVCIGISEEEAQRFGIDPARFKTFYWQEGKRIGGCGLSLSRKDALLRHANKPNSLCLVLRPDSRLIGAAL